jgi:hypothetical protein
MTFPSIAMPPYVCTNCAQFSLFPNHPPHKDIFDSAFTKQRSFIYSCSAYTSSSSSSCVYPMISSDQAKSKLPLISSIITLNSRRHLHSKLSQLPSNHVFSDIHIIICLPIVDGKLQPHKIREDRCCSRLGVDCGFAGGR